MTLKKIEIIELDLDKVNLWGCELGSCDLVVEAMVKGIELKHKFPLGYVIKMGDDDYYLNGDANNRAHAHYNVKSPFVCEVLSEQKIEADARRYLLAETPLSRFNFQNGAHRRKLKRALGHLPSGVIAGFCKENDLNSRCYLSQ